MKKSLSIILMILIGGFFAFTSCEDEEKTDPGTNPKATIKGQVKADFDLSNNATDINEDFAPQGTKIFFRIDAEDLVLNPDPNYDYQTLQYETTVDANGNYSISLPTATHQAVNVDIQPDQFLHDQTDMGGSDKSDVVFVSGGNNVLTKNGQTYNKDLTY